MGNKQDNFQDSITLFQKGRYFDLFLTKQKKILLQQHSLGEDQKALLLRRIAISHPNLINLIHFQQDFSGLCGGQKIKVYVEHCQRRLCAFKTHPQSFKKLFGGCLKAVRVLHKIFGYGYEIKANMVGVNTSGDVKLWVNQDWGSSHPSIRVEQDQTSQRKMVLNLLKVVGGSLTDRVQQNWFKPTSVEESLQRLNLSNWQ